MKLLFLSCNALNEKAIKKDDDVNYPCSIVTLVLCGQYHDDVIKWKHFPRYWPFVRRIHRSPVNSPHKGQWRGALMFSLISAWMNIWVNNRKAGDPRRPFGHYDVSVMYGKVLCKAPLYMSYTFWSLNAVIQTQYKKGRLHFTAWNMIISQLAPSIITHVG